MRKIHTTAPWHREWGMDGVDVQRTCMGRWLRKSWEQRGSQAASLLTLYVTRAGLAAGSKWEFNHGKHQHEIVHGSNVVGCKSVEPLGQCYTLCLSRGQKESPFRGEGSWAFIGTPQHCFLSWGLQGFPVGFQRSQILISCTHKPEDGEKYSNPCPVILQTGRISLALNTYLYSLKC